MSKSVTKVSFSPNESNTGSVRLNGSVSFDLQVDIEGAPENWTSAIAAVLNDAARSWLTDAIREATAELTAGAKDTEAEEESQEIPFAPFTFDAPMGLGDEPTSQADVFAPSFSDSDFAVALKPVEDYAGDVEPVEEVALMVDSEVRETQEVPVAKKNHTPEMSEARSELAALIARDLAFGPGLDEDSDGAFFSDVPITENVSTEHSHASIRINNGTDAETRDYTPTERPKGLDKTSPVQAVDRDIFAAKPASMNAEPSAKVSVERDSEWFNDDVIKDIVGPKEDSFEAAEDSDALIAALPSLNQRIGQTPSGRVPRPPSTRSTRFSDRAPTGSALARLQKRLRAQRREE